MVYSVDLSMRLLLMEYWGPDLLYHKYRLHKFDDLPGLGNWFFSNSVTSAMDRIQRVLPQSKKCSIGFSAFTDHIMKKVTITGEAM